MMFSFCGWSGNGEKETHVVDDEELLGENAAVDGGEEGGGERAVAVHLSVGGVELDVVVERHARLVLHVLVVQVGVQHDDREAQAVRHVRAVQLRVLRALHVHVLRERLRWSRLATLTSMMRSIC